jgi:glycosyltransferase involved in cell wall biosynthesis
VPEKGCDEAIECVAALPDVALVVAGDGPERARLEACATHHAPGRVHFLGSQADVVPVYHAADAIVFPTRGGDAMPAALIEAGLCAVPAVATAIGAIPEVIIDGETGVVLATDRVEDVASAVRSLLEDAGRRKTLGAAARVRCLEHYSIDSVASDYERVLEEALAS